MKYNFEFNSDNKTNEILTHGKLYHLERIQFHNDYRIDIVDNNNNRIHSDNTANISFYKVVDRTKSIDEQINQWVETIFNQFKVCDICGEYKLVLPLAEYDYEEFPHFRHKAVCQDCRGKAYGELLTKLSLEENEKINKQKQDMKKQGYKYQYTFWIHPNNGDDFAIDVYTSKKLTKKLVNDQKLQLIKEYNARLVEEPILEVI